MAESAETTQALDYRLTTGNQISWDVKVDLRVVISEEDHLREMGMTCFFVTGLYGDDLWFAIAPKTILDWAEYN